MSAGILNLAERYFLSQSSPSQKRHRCPQFLRPKPQAGSDLPPKRISNPASFHLPCARTPSLPERVSLPDGPPPRLFMRQPGCATQSYGNGVTLSSYPALAPACPPLGDATRRAPTRRPPHPAALLPTLLPPRVCGTCPHKTS